MQSVNFTGSIHELPQTFRPCPGAGGWDQGRFYYGKIFHLQGDVETVEMFLKQWEIYFCQPEDSRGEIPLFIGIEVDVILYLPVKGQFNGCLPVQEIYPCSEDRIRICRYFICRKAIFVQAVNICDKIPFTVIFQLCKAVEHGHNGRIFPYNMPELMSVGNHLIVSDYAHVNQRGG